MIGTDEQVEGEVEVEAAPVAAPARPRAWFIWLALPLVFALGLGSGWLLWGQTAAAQTAAAAGPEVQAPAKVTRYTIPVDGDPSIGPADAAITLVEFGDYQCPYCIQWYNTVAGRLLADYKGKIRFVFKDLPLVSIHPNAQSAAEAADCAGEQDSYWPYHDALFGEKHGLGAQAYSQYASDLGMDVSAFDDCVATHRYKNKVDANAGFAQNLGINSTPTFFINGLAVVGAQPYAVFQQVIDKELAGEIPK